MSLETRRKVRLETWKEVAAFFERDERTVKRWEAARGLPVHRLPGPGKSRIYAEVAELEAWQAGRTAPPRATMLALASRFRSLFPLSPRVLALGLAIVAACAVATWRLATPTAKPPPLAAQRLYVLGMEDWRKRTRDGLNRAAVELQGAIARDPDYGEAYAGLAECYDLLREYTLMPGSQAFPLARAAARRALALNPSLADAHAALAFADYYGFWDAEGAQREFKRAIALDPASQTAHHWYANFLMERGDNAGSLREIDRALALDPSSEAVQADRWNVLYHLGRRAEAFAGLRALEAADPGFLSPHNYLANLALGEGRDDEFLQEAASAARLTGDRNRVAQVEAATRGRSASGRQGLLRALLSEQLQQYQQGLASAYSVAETYALLDDGAAATDYLRTSLDRREPEATYVDGDIAFARLRATTAFKAAAALLKPS